MKVDSIKVVDKMEKSKFLAQKSISPDQANTWDSRGTELISPPYAISDIETAISEIDSLVTPLTTSTSGITTNKTCGLHVHIGLEDNSKLWIKALQHLAYLAIVYENEFSELHPAHRDDPFGIELNSIDWNSQPKKIRNVRKSGVVSTAKSSRTNRSIKSPR